MRAREQRSRKSRRGWGIYLSLISAAISAFVAIADVARRGTEAVNTWTDRRCLTVARTVASEVVHDSLEVHRQLAHPKKRR